MINNFTFNKLTTFQKHIAAFFFFMVLALILVFSWFRYGHLYGGGDVGIPSYDSERILNIARFIWWEASAPGLTVPQGLTSVPFQFFQAALHNLGFSYVQTQAIFFWLILMLSGYGMFLVGRKVFGEEKNFLSLLTGLFYTLNPYMMIQIWHRFIHNGFFLTAALPFFFLSFRSWIKEGRYFSLLVFLFINFLAVYLYGAIAFIITILFLLIFIGVFEIFFPWKGFVGTKVIAGRLFLGLAIWLAVHAWWLLPVYNISPALLSSQHSVTDSLLTLTSISLQTLIPYSLLGINPFYLYDQAELGIVFNSYFFRFLLWLPLMFLVPGFLIALKKKEYVFWALLASAGVFLAKGATSPFAYPYIFGFSNLFPLGVLRNPFEKLGIYIPFTYAILISLGIEWYLLRKRKKTYRLIIAVILFLILGINLWPMWSGNLFGRLGKPPFVEVPKSYIQADEYIKNQNKTGRILHLPLTVGESAAYDWEFGYSGVESSQLYFNSLPSLSRGLNVGRVDDALIALSLIFTLPNSEDKILTLLQQFSSKFIVLHTDMEWLGGYLPEPEKLEVRLDQLKFLEKKVKFGDLIVYELGDKFFNPKIKLVNNINFLISSTGSSYWPWLLSDERDLLSSLEEDLDEPLIKTAKQLIVFPESTFTYKSERIVNDNLLGEITAAKILPDSPLYLLIRIKEKIEDYFLTSEEKFPFQITLAGKRLTESYLLKKKGSLKSIIPQLQEYQSMLPALKENVELRTSGKAGSNELPVNFILSRHLAVLKILEEKAGSQEKNVVEETKLKLISFMQDMSTTPYYQLTGDRPFLYTNQLISRFNLPVAGQYELLQPHGGLQSVYPDNLMTNIFQINSEMKKLQGLASGNFMSYGMLNLPSGFNEISFNSVPSLNLIKMSDQIKMGDVKDNKEGVEITSGEHSPAYIDIDINPLRGGENYELTFESWIQLGDSFKVQVLQDTDQYDPHTPGAKILSYDNTLSRDSYINNWNSHVVKFYVKPTTANAKIRLLAKPWNGCKYQFKKQSICLNNDLKYKYEKISKVLFKNIKVVKWLDNPLFLRAALPNKNDTPVGSVQFTQKSAVSYSGKISLTSPGFFIFNETADPGWKLEIFSGKNIIPTQKFLSNLYGSAWYIKDPGRYDFRLEFTPQEKVGRGIILSVVSFVIITVLAVWQRVRR